MGRTNYFFTSESVTEGHPDKIADQISDSVLDAIYTEDPHGRVACETLVTTGLIFVAGEITTKAYVDIPKIARDVIKDIGYTRAKYGFDYETCSVITSIKKDVVPYLRPDGKSQVTVEYADGKPVRVDTVVISTQHSPDVTLKEIKEDMIEKVIKPVIPHKLLNEEKIKYHINPTGRFVVGGPMGDCGLTGRKIIVDTYGGVGSHGGGAFSGKDPSKVDRSASYMARYVAKNLVASGIADKCEVQIAYAIGVAEPVSIMIDTFKTEKIPLKKINELVREFFDMRPAKIIKHLNLRRPIYRKTAAYGHFGRELPEFTWEKTDKADAIRKAAGL